MTTNIKSMTPDSLKDEWRTPVEVFSFAEAVLGNIYFDTACTDENKLAMPIWKAAFNDGHTDDALACEWRGIVWCNPPYSDIDPWVEKAISSRLAITAILIPSPNGEERYNRIIANSHEIAIIGRLSFISPVTGNPVSGNTRGSSLFIINGYARGSRSVVERDWIMREFAQEAE